MSCSFNMQTTVTQSGKRLKRLAKPCSKTWRKILKLSRWNVELFSTHLRLDETDLERASDRPLPLLSRSTIMVITSTNARSVIIFMTPHLIVFYSIHRHSSRRYSVRLVAWWRSSVIPIKRRNSRMERGVTTNV